MIEISNIKFQPAGRQGQISNFQRGFTLIELLVVMSVISIVSVIGIASFTDYNRKESLNTAAQEFVTLLQTAKSRAQSQVKHPICISSQPLGGYKVRVIDSKTYELSAMYGNTSCVIETKTLPANIAFSSERPSFYFYSVSGGAGGGTVSILGYGHTRTITVTGSAVVTLQGVTELIPMTPLPTAIQSPTPTPLFILSPTPIVTPTPTAIYSPTPTPFPTPSCKWGYRDYDKDGYGAGGTEPYACYPLSTSYEVAGNNRDCYDKNAFAKPGNTTWQTSTRGTSAMGNDIGNQTWNSWDYDCNNTQEEEYPGSRDCTSYYNACGDNTPRCEYICSVDVACGGSYQTSCSSTWDGDCSHTGSVSYSTVFNRCR